VTPALREEKMKHNTKGRQNKMKLRDWTLILVVICISTWGCRPRQPEPSQDSTPTIEVKQKIEPKIEKPKTEPEPVAIEPPKPEPVAVEPPKPEPTVEDRLRTVLALQRAIQVPHKLPDGKTTVIRLEPDGIHVSSSSGIGKINMKDLPADL
jgi:type IV secretory pathway VirB10-like protein